MLPPPRENPAMISLLVSAASAFCGFYVGGADAQLYNDATLVVLLRDGTKTALSMQNSYQGPPEGFALVVPVPTVIQKEDVKTLPPEVFSRIDRLAAPRLVEYWERDPCDPYKYDVQKGMVAMRGAGIDMESGSAPDDDLGVKVEAQFSVAEYDIVILSAKDSSGLEKWLIREKYAIPAGASSSLRPYVESGTKFFVAKVDPKRVTFEGDRAVLSPLRVAYDTEQLALPVRLGLLNSKGEQDLLVHILGRDQRYEVANYPNTYIPTNLRVTNDVRERFGAFYEALFRNTIEDNPGAVVTEYAWQAGSCDPCPGPTLTDEDVATLGGDLVGDTNPMSWTLTRLHYRYGTNGLDEDLVFRKAAPVIGGRGTPDAEGHFTEEVQKSSSSQFQGRYAILHPWEGKMACKEPQRGIWGGPDGDELPTPKGAGDSMAKRTSEAIELSKVLLDPLPPAEVKPRRKEKPAE
ncbi:MAG: DUF2330 domain-containing protein [Alphaproteobacteria bacterium]|nr:DUF2330 domain-containing protein [Alphaproteobacteria bacterium]